MLPFSLNSASQAGQIKVNIIHQKCWTSLAFPCQKLLYIQTVLPVLLQRKHLYAAQSNSSSLFQYWLYLLHWKWGKSEAQSWAPLYFKDTQYSDLIFSFPLCQIKLSRQTLQILVYWKPNFNAMAGVQTDWNTCSNISLTHKVPAWHNLLDLDAGGSHRDDEHLIVPWRKIKGITQYLSVNSTQSHLCFNDSSNFICIWTTGWALWWWLNAFQLSLYLYSE